MTSLPPENLNRRVLICDDTPSIHEDFRKILCPARKQDRQSLSSMIASLKQGKSDDDEAAGAPTATAITYELEHAHQGQQALKMVERALEAGRPYALAFVDVRMPPGWDGIETIKRIWQSDSYLEMVICTAYSDYSWDSILDQIGTTDQLQFIRKPFDFVSIKQMGLALTTKWNLGLRSRQYVDDLEQEVSARTRQLSDKIAELEKALEEIRQLRGILPMCAYCHKIRDDANYWRAVDEYIRRHTAAEVSHGVCPDCYEKIMGKPL